mgnify:CR=1 FL=1
MAANAIGGAVAHSIQKLSEMKRQIIRYSVIANQADLDKKELATVTRNSSVIAQGQYGAAIGTLVRSWRVLSFSFCSGVM